MIRSVPARRLRGFPPAVIVVAAVAALVLASCGWFLPDPNVPTETGVGPVVEITPSADGPLAVACPTLAEARAAVPGIERGPDINTAPFKTMVLQCIYQSAGSGIPGGTAGIDILVFDASAEGKTMWDSVKTEPAFPNAADIPSLADVADVAFSTGTLGHYDVWVVRGKYAFHMYHVQPGMVALDQMVALSRAMLAGLVRAG